MLVCVCLCYLSMCVRNAKIGVYKLSFRTYESLILYITNVIFFFGGLKSNDVIGMYGRYWLGSVFRGSAISGCLLLLD